MGFFAGKYLVVALILIGGFVAFPVGALRAARNARRKYARTPHVRALTGAQVSGILLHREGLSSVAVGAGADALGERYSPHAGRVELSEETARLRSVYAVAIAAFCVAKVTLHADGDPDFARMHRRAGPIAILANLFPAAIFAALLVPGEGRAFAFVVAPVILLFLASYTAMSLPGERRAAERALALLTRHGFVSDKKERDALRSVLSSRAALVLSTPLTRCYWVSWAL